MSKKLFNTMLVVTGLVTVCCFTPLLVVALGLIGLGAVAVYLDYVLFPLLAILVALTIFAYVHWKKSKQVNNKISKNNSMDNASLTCPHCQHKQGVDIPQTGCLAFHVCENCAEIISVPESSVNCCVICEYSDTTCPIGRKK